MTRSDIYKMNFVWDQNRKKNSTTGYFYENGNFTSFEIKDIHIFVKNESRFVGSGFVILCEEAVINHRRMYN